MTRSRLLALFAVCVVVGGALLWHYSRTDNSSSANVAEPGEQTQATAPADKKRPPSSAAVVEARAPDKEPPPPPEEEIEPDREPDLAPRQPNERPEGERPTGAVLKVAESVSDEELNGMLEKYGLVVQRRFKGLVRVAHPDGGDVTSAVEAIENDGLLELDQKR